MSMNKLDDSEYPDVSIFFSIWIIVWFLLYYFGIFDYNPSFVLLLCQVVLIASLYSVYIQYGAYYHYDDIKDKINIIISKFLPLFLLWLRNDVQVRKKDLYFSIGFCVVYSLYLYSRNTNFIKIYTIALRNQKCRYSCTGR